MDNNAFHVAGILQYAGNSGQSQEQLQKALLRAGQETRVAPPQLPTAPHDILGYPSAIMKQPEQPSEQTKEPGAGMMPDVPPDAPGDNDYTPEHAAAGAVPCDDDIITG